jgi:CopG family nickel-responsive transcriptional regulator
MILSVSLPEPLVRNLDHVVTQRGYRGRSAAMRAALTEFLRQQRREGELGGQVATVAVLGYPERAERALSEIRHDHNDLVTSLLHAHTPKGRCATVILAEGPADRVRTFLTRLRSLKDLESFHVENMR